MKKLIGAVKVQDSSLAKSPSSSLISPRTRNLPPVQFHQSSLANCALSFQMFQVEYMRIASVVLCYVVSRPRNHFSQRCNVAALLSTVISIFLLLQL